MTLVIDSGRVAAPGDFWSRWSLGSLCLWGIGTQINEAVATVGLALTCVFALVKAWRARAKWRDMLKRWAPLWVFSAWAIGAPLLAGRLPTGTGLARLFDWMALPAAAWGLSELFPRDRARWAALCASAFLLSCMAAGMQSYGVWPSLETIQHVPWLHLPLERVYESAPGGERLMGGGLLFHRLKFAHCGALVVLAAFSHALASRGSARFWGWVVAGMGTYSIAAFPFARGALVALIAGMVLIAVIGQRRKWMALLWAVVPLAGLTLALLLSPSLRERFESARDSAGNGDRLALWRTGLRAAAEHPLVGLGLGRFHPGDFATSGNPLHDTPHVVKAHNQWLTVAAETGWPGLALFAFLLAWIARQIDATQVAGLAGMGGLLFFALLSLAHDPLFHAPFSMGLVLVLGYALAESRGVQSGSTG